MKWLLARIGLPKAIGLFLNEAEATLSQVVATPLGPIEIERKQESLADEDCADVVQRLVGPLVGKRKFRRPPVSVGLAARKVYFSTRPVHAATGDSSPHVLLREALRSPNAPVNDMVVDVIKGDPDSRQVASIAACDKIYLNQILDALAQLDVQPCRIEPGPCALLRLAESKHRTRRGDKVVLRLFLSDTQVLTVLVVEKMPLLWRFTPLPQGEEAAALVTACRSMLATSKDCGVESPLNIVMIHGRAELKRLVDTDWIEEQFDATIQWHDGPALNQEQVALGLAQGSLDRNEDGFDLARSLKPRPKLMQLFPWREAILQFALLACMGLFLGYQYWTLQEAKQSLQTRAAASGVDAGMTKKQLTKEKRELEERVSAIREFLGSRILWTTFLQELQTRVPGDMYLMSIRADCGLKNMAKGSRAGKVKKSIVLRGAVKVPPDGLVPQEVDHFLEAIRSLPTLEKEFPLVTLDELKQVQGRIGEIPTAIFSVVCLPAKKGSKASGSTSKSANK